MTCLGSVVPSTGIAKSTEADVASFKEAKGRPVVSRSSAERLGRVGSLVADGSARRVAAVLMGSGRKASAIEWGRVAGFGPDAVVVDDGDGADDQDLKSGRLDPLGKRLLTDHGDEVGVVDDVEFDPDTAALTAVLSDQGHRIGAQLLRGIGSYAVVVSGSPTD